MTQTPTSTTQSAREMADEFDKTTPYATIFGPIYRYDLTPAKHETILAALRSAAATVSRDRIDELSLWENGFMTRAQLASWTDDDIAKHAAGIRKTLTFLFEKLDAATPAACYEAGEMREAVFKFMETAYSAVSRVAQANYDEVVSDARKSLQQAERRVYDALNALAALPVQGTQGKAGGEQ